MPKILSRWVLLLVMLLAWLGAPAALQAQESPIEFLLRQRQLEKQKIAPVPRAQRQGSFVPAPRATPKVSARSQRQPRRVGTGRKDRATTLRDIIASSEPAAPAPGIPRQPPIPGLALASPKAEVLALSAPSLTDRKRLMVVGDSIGIQLGQGLREAFADRPEIEIDSRAKADTGLVNPGSRDLPAYLAQILPNLESRPDILLVMTGTNDNQKLRDGSGTLADALSDGWRDAYSARIDAILEPARAQKIPVIWVGLPQMRNEKLSNAASGFNGLFRDRLQKAGFVYRDIWEGFTTETGAYAPDGPSIDGEIVRLRAGDGVHFTRAGSRKLAFFVEKDIRNLLSDSTTTQTPNPPNGLVAPASPQAAPNSGEPAIAMEGDIAPAFPAKPAAGPTMTLTVEPVASELAGTAPGTVRTETSFGKPGRADDFSWPQ